MKISPVKFSIALGLAFSISFILCNLLLMALGRDITLQILNSIFHEVDFKPLLTGKTFTIGKLFHGTLFLFVAGALIGFITVFTYNLLTKKEEEEIPDEDNSAASPEKVIIIQGNADDSEEKRNEPRQHIGYKR